MTSEIQQSLRMQLKEATKDLTFRKAFNKMNLHELKRLKSRKNLLMFSMVYGATIIVLAALIF
ncbi:hypothetical protein I5907_11375 [Panacibacter sp. DH6]|uniref:Uncharacterized protein n=1 Tax=Panacibacter microcysteis TaxID=2793269 RepID=A0A931GVV1_9BACT|nr:hypothetical protein [Panacibacter microcysteis]MBG9376840.1 hypothetical protein [Panacibacter microcysteis]